MKRNSRRWLSNATAPAFSSPFTRSATAPTTSRSILLRRSLAANGPRDRRDRVEHAQVVAPEDFARFGQLDIVASMQPSHLLDDERWASDRLGPERSRDAYAWRTMEQNGVHLAFGTDHPVEPLNPLRGIYACVTRELPQGSAELAAAGKRCRSRIVCAPTPSGSAYAEFEENRKGTIAPGMLADLVVYPADLNRNSRARLADDSSEDDHCRRPHRVPASGAGIVALIQCLVSCRKDQDQNAQPPKRFASSSQRNSGRSSPENCLLRFFSGFSLCPLRGSFDLALATST